MRTDSRELLAVGIFGNKSRLGDRIEILLRRGRTFSSRVSGTSIAASTISLCGLMLGASLFPRWVAFETPAFAQQSQPAGRQAFELASIKPCRNAGRANTKMEPAGGTPNVSPGRLNTGCAALAAEYPFAGLVQRAYGGLGLGRLSLGSALPVAGGPRWVYSDRYVINAKAADQAGEQTMEGPMLQALLEDRFKLKVHREAREVPVYALTVAKDGPRLQPADENCVLPDPSVFPRPALPEGKRYCNKGGVGARKGPNTLLNEEPATIDYFCTLLGLVMDRPVINRTGLAGNYNFHLEFAIDQSTPGAVGASFGTPSDDPPAPSIFTVVQQQLGLKLEAVKGPRDFLVIDHVERPSGN